MSTTPHWIDQKALEVARRFTQDTEPQRRASLQLAVAEAMQFARPDLAAPAPAHSGLLGLAEKLERSQHLVSVERKEVASALRDFVALASKAATPAHVAAWECMLLDERGEIQRVSLETYGPKTGNHGNEGWQWKCRPLVYGDEAAPPDAVAAEPVPEGLTDEPAHITGLINDRCARYALDQTCTPEFLHWLDTMAPREGVGANEAWNAAVAWARAAPDASPSEGNAA